MACLMVLPLAEHRVHTDDIGRLVHVAAEEVAAEQAAAVTWTVEAASRQVGMLPH